MKNILTLAIFALFISCKAQKNINSIYENNLPKKIIRQFNEKYKINSKNAVYALFIKENPEINSVANGITTSTKSSGTTITVYSFETKEQIYEFTNEFNVYKGNEFEYYIFEKNSSKNFLSNLKKNMVTNTSHISDDSYEPKSWVLSFDKNGIITKCFPIICN